MARRKKYKGLQVTSYAQLEESCATLGAVGFYINDSFFPAARCRLLLPGMLEDYIRRGKVFAAALGPTRNDLRRIRVAGLTGLQPGRQVYLYDGKKGKDPVPCKLVAVVPAGKPLSSIAGLDGFIHDLKPTAARKTVSCLVSVEDGGAKPPLFWPRARDVFPDMDSINEYFGT